MLANGIKLQYSKDDGSSYKELPGLKEVPELGEDPEKVDNTCLSDTTKQYEYGIGDYGDLAYKFKYVNDSEESSYRVLRKLAKAKTVVPFKQIYPDGTEVTFKAQCSVKLGGGSVNSVIEFTLNLALQSAPEIKDPSDVKVMSEAKQTSK